MAKVILICGKICSGKSTYAQQLRRENRAVVLSIDEVMLAFFGQHCGSRHDEYADRAQKYLLDQSLALIEAGVDVILDWGFWRKEKRDVVREFYTSRHIPCEFHFIGISQETWRTRLDQRNSAVRAGMAGAYLVDSNLAEKFESRFEMPGSDEIDVWVKQ